MSLTRRDGADFDSVQGARSERCQSIVSDERHGNGPKSARPYEVALGRSPTRKDAPQGRLAPASDATTSGERFKAIMVGQTHGITL